MKVLLVSGTVGTCDGGKVGDVVEVWSHDANGMPFFEISTILEILESNV